MVIANFGNLITFFEFQITLDITNVPANTKLPNNAPQEINAPSVLEEADYELNMSGAPLAKAIRVTAARVGERLNFSERSYIPTARYLSAIVATHKKRIG